jgi:hypothetical protein
MHFAAHVFVRLVVNVLRRPLNRVALASQNRFVAGLCKISWPQNPTRSWHCKPPGVGAIVIRIENGNPG